MSDFSAIDIPTYATARTGRCDTWAKPTGACINALSWPDAGTGQRSRTLPAAEGPTVRKSHWLSTRRIYCHCQRASVGGFQCVGRCDRASQFTTQNHPITLHLQIVVSFRFDTTAKMLISPNIKTPPIRLLVSRSMLRIHHGSPSYLSISIY